MTYLEEKLAIEGFFQANWTETEYVFENGESPAASEWVRFSIQNGDAFQASLGDNPAFRYPGVVFVQIFTLKDTGSGRALEIADAADLLFKLAVVDGIVFKVPQIRKVNAQDTEWYQVNVSIEFYRGS